MDVDGWVYDIQQIAKGLPGPPSTTAVRLALETVHSAAVGSQVGLGGTNADPAGSWHGAQLGVALQRFAAEVRPTPVA